jgi:hypothetical protein
MKQSRELMAPDKGESKLRAPGDEGVLPPGRIEGAEFS